MDFTFISLVLLVLLVSTLEKVHVGDDGTGVSALDRLVVAVLALEVNRLFISAFPGRENECHVISIQAVTHLIEVV